MGTGGGATQTAWSLTMSHTAKLRFRRVAIPSDYETDAERVALGLLQPASLLPIHPDRAGLTNGIGRSLPSLRARAMWLGSPDALAILGLKPGANVSTDQVRAVLQGRHAQTGESVRVPTRLTTPLPGEAGSPFGLGDQTPDRTPVVGMRQLVFTLPAPSLAADVWGRSSPDHRDTIARALLVGAEKAIAHMVVGKPVVKTRRNGRQRQEVACGMAVVASVHPVAQPSNRPPGQTVELNVHGVLLGVQRADGTLVAVDGMAMLRDDAVQKAGEVALGAFVAELPWLRYFGRRAVAAVLALQGETAVARLREREMPRKRDPVEAWRQRVGDRRADDIGERANELGDHLAALEDSELLGRRRALTARFVPPNRAEVFQALSLEREVTRLEESANAARRDVAALHAEGARLRRSQMPQVWRAVAVIERRIADGESARDRLLRADDRLPAKQGLDAWMGRHLEQVAQVVAIDRQLTENLHEWIARDIDCAVLDPPDYIRTAIGGAPQTAREHSEWVELTSAVVREHHVATANRAAGYELQPGDGREQRRLDERLRSWRERHGLAPTAQDMTIETASPAPGQDV